MATIITDELKLLITAEAEAAIRELGSYKTALNELDAAHKQASTQSDQTTKTIDEQTVSMKEAEAAIKDASEATRDAGDTTKQYTSGLDKVDDAQTVVKVGAKEMGKALLAAFGPIAIVLKTLQVVKEFTVDSAAAYAEAQGEARKFSITYRDVAKDAEEAAKSWASTFGYAESTAQSVLGSAGDMYTGMGMSGEAALALAERTTYLGGALSKLNPQIGSASEATRALITATTGEREALKTWGIIISEAAIQTKLLERGQKDLTGAAMLNAKAQATLDIAYEQSPNALAAVTSATQLAADTNRELSEAWKEQMELSGEIINKVFQPIKGALADWIKGMNEAQKAQRDAMKIDPNIDLINSYGDTADKVDDLVNTYEALNEKAFLTKEEQSDLKNIMIEIGSLVPSAVTSWNDYGEAIAFSTSKAKEFADQQREIRLAEAELQLLRLDSQQKAAGAEYEENKEKLAVLNKERSETQEILNNKQDEYLAAVEIKKLLKNPPEGMTQIDAVLDYIRKNKEILEGTVFNLRDAELSNFKLGEFEINSDSVVYAFEKLQDDLSDLEIERAQLSVDTKEYEIFTAQIEQTRAEIKMLTGDYKPLIKQLEDQIVAAEGSNQSFIQLKRQYDTGSLTAEEYAEALQSVVNALKAAGEEGSGLEMPALTASDADKFKDLVATPDQKALKEYLTITRQAAALWDQQLITAEEYSQALSQANSGYEEAIGLSDDKQRAQELITSLLSEEQEISLELYQFESELQGLKEKGLISEEQMIALLKEREETMSAISEEEMNASDFINKKMNDLKDEFFSFSAMSELLSDTFADIGAAMASGDDIFAASSKALQSFVSDLLAEISTMAIGAGLRVIVDMGVAGIPIALGLFALGGIAGIAGGFFGASGQGLDSSIQDTLSEELAIRESLNEALSEQLDIEKDILRHQLDRNLISIDEYISGMGDIQQQENQSDAYAEALSLVSEHIADIDSDLSDMSGWTKFWTQNDEDLEEEADALAALAEEINAATSAEELKALIAELEKYGIDTSSIPAFATGGDFLTNGPQLIKVGDNPSGRERVSITPLGSSGGLSAAQPIVININGPVLDFEDLKKKLDQTGVKLQRKHIS